eukprot:m.1122539 g.1122539  ORF g.1122539 m.1122539 type:complete len:757 (+) comp24402_c2_seq3:192-2462(+)
MESCGGAGGTKSTGVTVEIDSPDTGLHGAELETQECFKSSDDPERVVPESLLKGAPAGLSTQAKKLAPNPNIRPANALSWQSYGGIDAGTYSTKQVMDTRKPQLGGQNTFVENSQECEPSSTTSRQMQESDPLLMPCTHRRPRRLCGGLGGVGRCSYIVTGVLAIGAITTISVLTLLKANTSSDGGYSNGAVASDASVCSSMGVQIMQKGGSAVDAAVTTSLCIGVVNSHSTGIGGGGFMVVYNGSHAETIDYRERAPASAREDMYMGFSTCNSTGGQGDTSRCPSRLGGLAVAIPGELRGLELAHQRHGWLPWRDVVMPVVSMCRQGFAISGANANAVRVNEEIVRESPMLKAMFIDSNDAPIAEGTLVTRPVLADTLEQVALHGADAMYTGTIAQNIVDTIRSNVFQDGNMSLQDLQSYRAVVNNVTSGRFQGLDVLSAPAPASGAVLTMVLNMLRGYSFNCEDGRTALTDHRIVEAFKFAYAYRSRLADPCCAHDGAVDEQDVCINATQCSDVSAAEKQMLDVLFDDSLRERIRDNSTASDPKWYGADFDVKDTAGTTHISIVGPGNQAVALTSTINLNFGAKIVTPDGIILNNEMDDFSSPGASNSFGLPPSANNFIRPYKKPLSSSSPVIFLDDEGAVQLVSGASGGTKITTAVAQVVLEVLTFCRSPTDAVNAPRLHHQLVPMHISGEPDYSVAHREYLKQLGHAWNVTSSNGVCQTIGRGTVGAATLDPTKWYPASDSRRKSGAAPAGF